MNIPPNFLWIVLLLLVTACGGQPTTLKGKVMRVGYFPNITHSQAIVGLARGDFQKAFGSDVTLKTIQFNAGPSLIEALFAGEVDLGYIGPNPAINGYIKSKGEALRIVAGATNAGAAFVVRPSANIKQPSDLNGKKFSTPQLGNTQDVALRGYLIENGLNTIDKGGRVEIVPTDNPQILDLFRQEQIDGAWVPEPWASRLVVEGGGVIFLDERARWAKGDFATAHIIVSTKFLKANPDLVKAWLTTHVEVTQWEVANPKEAQTLLNNEIEKLTGKKLKEEVIMQAWGRMRPTWDPISSSLIKSADAAYADRLLFGFLERRIRIRWGLLEKS